MRKKIFLFLVFLILILSSCLKPSDETKEIKLLNYVDEVLKKVNELKDKPEEQLEYFKNMQNNFQAILAFYKNTEIYINSKEANPSVNDFMYTLDNNKFVIKKPIYFTIEKGGSIYSLDNKTWYLSKSDPNLEIEGVQNDYYFDSKVIDNKFYVNYKMSFSIGRAPKIIKPRRGKKIVTLKKGMIFATQEEEKITSDVTKEILYLPAGTILSGKLNVDGNFIKSDSKDDVLCIKSLRDLFFYVKKKFFSMSFDKKNWNVNILSFEVEPIFEVKAIEDDHIFFNINVNANYYKDKISFSIINLLLRSM